MAREGVWKQRPCRDCHPFACSAIHVFMAPSVKFHALKNHRHEYATQNSTCLCRITHCNYRIMAVILPWFNIVNYSCNASSNSIVKRIGATRCHARTSHCLRCHPVLVFYAWIKMSFCGNCLILKRSLHLNYFFQMSQYCFMDLSLHWHFLLHRRLAWLKERIGCWNYRMSIILRCFG